MTTRELSSAPSMLPIYLKAVAPALPGLGMLPGVRRGGDELPDLEIARNGVTADLERLTSYAEVCGFTVRDAIPVTYPHILAFPLQMALMTDGSFPFPPMGMVHVANRITQHRPIRSTETLDLRVRAADLRPHPKGRQFGVVSEARVGDELVWRDVSTYLRRGGGGEGAQQGAQRAANDVPEGATTWRLPGDLGRRYAGVSGDHNPIHLYGLTAKAFGFRRAIAHGMWSKARCVAALESRLPDAVDVEVEFKKPVLLPSTVAFGSRAGDGEVEFGLRNVEKGTVHLVGHAVSIR
ncbi:MAG: hypothetical protein GEU93_02775 [Propionibacteriales bacterium]|nr:hypothetical protein [Propionibacteriales bacterium]